MKDKKLLIAIDGSQSSKNALIQVLKLASMGKYQITAISVAPAYKRYLDWPEIENLKSVIEKNVDKILSEANKIATDHNTTIETISLEGEAYQAICILAKRGNFDFIVMGRRGLNHLEKAPMGSVTASVIDYADKNVLVIPQKSNLCLDNLLLVIDSLEYSERTIYKAIKFVKSYGGKLKILSVIDEIPQLNEIAPDIAENMIQENKAYLEKIKDKILFQGVKAEIMVKIGEPYKIITHLTKELNISIIIMGSHGESGFKRYMKRGTAERIIAFTSCPILIMKD